MWIMQTRNRRLTVTKSKATSIIGQSTLFGKDKNNSGKARVVDRGYLTIFSSHKHLVNNRQCP